MPARSLPRRSLLAGVVLCLHLPAGAVAQHGDEDTSRPARYLASASVGVPLRLTRSSEFGQSRVAPTFMDAMGGYVLPGGSRLRHGAGLGLSFNLAHDGGYTEPIAPWSQLVVMPSYLLYVDASPDLYCVGHLGLPILLHGGTSAGAELGFALGYRMLAGFGSFAQAGLDLFPGASSTAHLTFSLAAGLFLDYEVLP
jgi:hypothetical protein